jgi:hypothetical protein
VVKIRIARSCAALPETPLLSRTISQPLPRVTPPEFLFTRLATLCHHQLRVFVFFLVVVLEFELKALC